MHSILVRYPRTVTPHTQPLTRMIRVKILQSAQRNWIRPSSMRRSSDICLRTSIKPRFDPIFCAMISHGWKNDSPSLDSDSVWHNRWWRSGSRMGFNGTLFTLYLCTTDRDRSLQPLLTCAFSLLFTNWTISAVNMSFGIAGSTVNCNSLSQSANLSHRLFVTDQIVYTFAPQYYSGSLKIVLFFNYMFCPLMEA